MVILFKYYKTMYKPKCPKCGKDLIKEGLNVNGFTIYKKCNHKIKNRKNDNK